MPVAYDVRIGRERRWQQREIGVGCTSPPFFLALSEGSGSHFIAALFLLVVNLLRPRTALFFRSFAEHEFLRKA